MMPNYERTSQYAHQRQAEMQREAERIRLANEIAANGKAGPLRHALTITGDALIAAGTRLKQATPPAINAAPAYDTNR